MGRFKRYAEHWDFDIPRLLYRDVIMPVLNIGTIVHTFGFEPDYGRTNPLLGILPTY